MIFRYDARDTRRSWVLCPCLALPMPFARERCPRGRHRANFVDRCKLQLDEVGAPFWRVELEWEALQGGLGGRNNHPATADQFDRSDKQGHRVPSVVLFAWPESTDGSPDNGSDRRLGRSCQISQAIRKRSLHRIVVYLIDISRGSGISEGRRLSRSKKLSDIEVSRNS